MIDLDYAPRPSLRRRAALRVGWALLLIGIAASAVRWGPRAWRTGAMLYWQHRCLADGPPADQVVYEEDPARFAAVLKQGPEFAMLSPQAVGRVPASWARFQPAVRAVLRVGPTAGAVVFMHERRSPSGEPRLVVIRSAFDPRRAPPLFIAGFDVDVSVCEPGTWNAPVTDRSPAIRLSVMYSRPQTPSNLKIYAGQADPADPSHFTINYQCRGKPGLVDGWLRANGQVELKVRDGPSPY